LCLMVETLNAAGIKNIYLDIGHVGIYRGLSKQAGFDEAQEATLFEMMQRKAIPEIQAFLAEQSIDQSIKDMLNLLPELHGGNECLQRATDAFANADTAVKDALQYLQQAVLLLKQRIGDIAINFDLSELRGFHYHTGLLFAAYTLGEGQEIARGGRYDDIGQVFGRARPATGFSTDIKTLLNLSDIKTSTLNTDAILAPGLSAYEADSGLWKAISELRAKGETVIQSLPGQQGSASDVGCSRELKNNSGKWIVE